MRLPDQLWLCTQPTDMRCSFTGLSAIVRQQLGDNPLSGQGFVFINRRRTQLKCLYFEAGGYCLWSKRLEQGQFGGQTASDEAAVALSPAEFQALVEGLDWAIKRRRKRWKPRAE